VKSVSGAKSRDAQSGANEECRTKNEERRMKIGNSSFFILHSSFFILHSSAFAAHVDPHGIPARRLQRFSIIAIISHGTWLLLAA
jgi:hypothetical protein